MMYHVNRWNFFLKKLNHFKASAWVQVQTEFFEIFRKLESCTNFWVECTSVVLEELLNDVSLKSMELFLKKLNHFKASAWVQVQTEFFESFRKLDSCTNFWVECTSVVLEELLNDLSLKSVESFLKTLFSVNR